MTRWKSEKGISSSYRSLISPGQNILNVEFSPRGIHLVSQMIKSLPAMRETHIQSLGWEDPLEKEIAIHSSILAWRISWTEEPGGLQSMGFSRQEYWSELRFPSPGDLPKPRDRTRVSCIAGRRFTI